MTKRKKGSRYITGTHTSTKCSSGPVKYRSSWELVVCLHLDESIDVAQYSYESIIIPYKSNARTGKERKYYPDFLVEYKDGRKVIIEVKRSKQTTSPIVVKKAKAGEEWAKQNQMEYIFWTEKEILPLRKHFISTMPEKFQKKNQGPKSKKRRKKKPLSKPKNVNKRKAVSKKAIKKILTVPSKLPWV